MFALQLRYGSEKHDCEISEGALLVELMAVIEEKIGVPETRQKIILNGKSFTFVDKQKTLSDLKFKDGAKVMVLGKKLVDQSDELVKQIHVVKEKSTTVSLKLDTIKNELRDIENGHLDSKLQPEALKQLRKRCQICNEELMKNLETFDSFSFEENQSRAKQIRKSAVNETNLSLDEAEGLVQKIDSILSKF